jgi:hypothetical protein
MPTVPALYSPALLITTNPPMEPLGFWNFGTPFDNTTWILLVGTFFFQGFVQWIVLKKKKDDEPSAGYSPTRYTASVARCMPIFFYKSRKVGSYPHRKGLDPGRVYSFPPLKTRPHTLC